MSKKPVLLRMDSEGPILDYLEIPEGYSESSLHAWARFCALCFSEKENAPREQYFLAQFNNDPFRDSCKIFVAIDRSSQTWRGSIRTVTRHIWRGDRYINITGIADVCTEKRSRGVGVGYHMICAVLQRLKDSGQHTFLLHANEKFHHLYTNCGFHMVRSHWSVISAQINERDVEDFCREYKKKVSILAIGPEAISSSAGMFAKMSESLTTMLYLQGAVEKPTAYINSWVRGSQILYPRQGGKCYCLCDRKFIYDCDTIDERAFLKAAVGYIILGPSQSSEEGYHRVYDLGILPLYADRFAEFLMYFAIELSQGTIFGEESKSESKSDCGHIGKTKFEIPSAVGIYLASSGLFQSHMAQVDNGFMILTDDIETRATFDAEFSYWPIDYF
jgi:GNAT superfamily N-acetyltransferase